MSSVFDVPDVVLHEHPRSWSNRHRYDVVGLDGTVHATVEEQGGSMFLGAMVSSRYLVTAAGEVVLTIDRPGKFGKMEFHAARPDGTPLGRVRQENSWGAPRLELATPEGAVARMTGGAWGSRDWQVTLVADPRPPNLRKPGAALGAVYRRKRSFGRALVDADAFSIGTDPTLDPDLRALVLVAVVALDGVRDNQKSSGD